MWAQDSVRVLKPGAQVRPAFDAASFTSLYSLVSCAPPRCTRCHAMSYLACNGFRGVDVTAVECAKPNAHHTHGVPVGRAPCIGIVRFWTVPATEPKLECSAPCLEEYTREHQTYLSAEAHSASSRPGLPRPHGNQGRAGRDQCPPPQGPSFIVGFDRG